MDSQFYFSLIGFSVFTVTMFYFIARYKEAAAGKTAPPLLKTSGKTDIETISGHISEFREKIEEIRSVVNNKQLLHEKQIEEIVNGINVITARLEKADPLQIDRVQPSIDKLFNELEKLKIPALIGSLKSS